MAALLEIYERRVAAGELRADPHQKQAAQTLDTLLEGLSTPRRLFRKVAPVHGVYLYGGVGRGKSMVMDLFFSLVPDGIKKRRVHFHAFMIETHDWLHNRRGEGAVDNLLPDYAAHVARQVRLLCFDEFHVTDVADAMILSRLFSALLDKGVVVVATSNWPPDRLYDGGLQRVRFLPFIELIKDRLDIVHLDSDTDHRALAVPDLETYLFPLSAATTQRMERFYEVFSDGAQEREETLTVKGRTMKVQAAGGAARFTFAQLCEQPLGAEDYLRIAERFHTVFIGGIPKMGYDRSNEVKRLMTLIDVLYDRRRRVVISAEAAPEKIYYGRDYAFEFARTISRLNEMRSSSYTAGVIV